mgnify:CR=1 FL=1
MLNTLPLGQLIRISIAIGTALFPLAVTIMYGGVHANAAIRTVPESTRDPQLIANQDLFSANINRQQQADIEGIYQTLTQRYRGINELNAERIERTLLSVSVAEKAFNRNLFRELKANHVDSSNEVLSIELISLSKQNAMVKVEEILRARQGNQSKEFKRSLLFKMVKTNGLWKIINFVETPR